MKSKINRIFYKAKGVPPKNHKQQERTLRGGGGMMNKGREMPKNFVLKDFTLGEIPIFDQMSELWIFLQLQ